MANPPPNNPLLPLVTTGAIVPTYVVSEVEVFHPPQQDINAPQTSITLTSHFEESVKQTNTNEALRWYDLEQYTNQVRLRVIVCNEPRVCERLDYLQQRFGEYVSGQMGPINSVAADMLNNLLKRSTDNDEIINSLLNTFGPFDAGELTQHFLETRDRTYNYEQYEMIPVLGKTLVYDIPAVNVLQTDDAGNVLRRNTNRTISMRDGDGQVTRHLIEQIPAQPISITLDVDRSEMSQFSVYSFAYLDVFSYTDGEVQSIGGEVFSVVESGLGYISAANFAGQYSLYSPQDQAIFEEEDGETQLGPGSTSPTRIVGMVNPRLHHAPNGDQMHDFRTYANIAIDNLNNRIFENLPKKVGVSNVGNKRKVIIGDKNYFSHLWLSKDVSEGCRYSFSFALRGFMINNSRFPWLYQNEASAEELLNGGSIIQTSNEDRVDERTRILDISMTKKLVDFEEFAVINKLGTSVRQHEKRLDSYNEETVVAKPRRLDTIHLENNPSEKIIFYEGRDNLADEKLTQQLSRIQYGTTIIIQDSAETYITKHIEILESASKRTREIFELIVHSPPAVDVQEDFLGGAINTGIGLFDYETMTTRFPLSRISYGGLNAEQEVSAQIEKYLVTLRSFGVIVQDEYNNLLVRLKSLMRSSNPQGLEIIADSIDTFAGVLREVVGDNSRRFIGDFRENQKDKITGRGTYEQKVPIFECQHYFDNFITSGLTFGTGYEYLRQTESNSQAHGLIRISRQGYIDRTINEFNKYFYFSKDMGVSSQTAAYSPSYANSTATFLTPNIIRTYGKELINQPLYRRLDGPNTAYDLDRYAELFGDLVKIADKSAYLKGSYYMLEDETEDDTENKQLYNSVITSLVERHMFNIKFNDLVQTPTLEPIDTTPRVSLNPQQLEAIDLFNVLAGGASDLSFDAVTWRQTQESAQENAFSSISPTVGGLLNTSFKPSPVNPRVDLPIKLVFSILGELELDPAYYVAPNYMSKEFNSIKNQALSLGITADNIKDIIEGDFSSLPNQIKSMFVVAISNRLLSLGPGFDATRNLLDEGAGPLSPTNKVTTVGEDANLPYKETLDTMKIYSKMLAYWLNYKEICVIEYLRGFEKTSNDLMQVQTDVMIGGEKVDMSMQGQTVIATNPYTSKPKLPVWEKLTPEKLRVSNKGNLLCRVRRIVPNDSKSRVVKQEESNTSGGLYGLVGGDIYDNSFSGKNESKIITQQVDFQSRELFNLRIYNQYFILGTAGYRGGDRR